MANGKNERKTICVQYETGKTKTIKKNGRDVTVPETKLLTVGSAFLQEENKAGDPAWLIQGKFHAVPPQWDGKFILLDPILRDEEMPPSREVGDEDVPY